MWQVETTVEGADGVLSSYYLQSVKMSSPWASPVTRFSRAAGLFPGSTYIAVRSAGKIVSSACYLIFTVHSGAIPVSKTEHCPGWWLRATIPRVIAVLASVSLLEILVLAGGAHPISSCPAHFSILQEEDNIQYINKKTWWSYNAKLLPLKRHFYNHDLPYQFMFFCNKNVTHG